MLVAAKSLSRTNFFLTTPAYRAEEPDQKVKNKAQWCTSRAIQLVEGGRKQGCSSLSLYGNSFRTGGRKLAFIYCIGC
jgi:hypothetical protein